MKISIRALDGDISQYKELLEKSFDYERHYNVYHTKWIMRTEYKLDELKDVEINTVKELFDAFKEFEGYAYDGCQLAVNIDANIIYIFNRSVE
ncbi:hypothetical protein BEH_07750 [Priestia filamentosa]|uniref:Uncharacterized protein n=1 Tax=Priestia filamentosa TaxID=1402861 RepID=A0A0H4KUM7_9BACI|nr:hypothetical protein [Priestia filamentosa]AKO92003.1 hypothetical protein BEH_07750 [Priestia filamentosa]